MKVLNSFKWAILFIAVALVGIFGSSTLFGANQTTNFIILGGFAIVMFGSIYLFLKDYKKFRNFDGSRR